MHATCGDEGDPAGVERLAEPGKRHIIACQGVKLATPTAGQDWKVGEESPEGAPYLLTQSVSFHYSTSLC